MRPYFLIVFCALFVVNSCSNSNIEKKQVQHPLKPFYISEPTKYDTDDPAIWINPVNPANSLILGTDKNEDGAVYVYDLKGKIIADKVIYGLKRPNNIDVAYGVKTTFGVYDLALISERLTGKVRIYSLPDMKAMDGGGIDVYVGETAEEYRDLMGIATYKDPKSHKVYVIPGRKKGPTNGTYLWQYELYGDAKSQTFKAKLVRKFGAFSGKKEIEALAVDSQLGYIYYCDETYGIRKYYANPKLGDKELALFGKTDFKEDHEGISIYCSSSKQGYIIISDQQRNCFNIYPREGSTNKRHNHQLICRIPFSTIGSDGNEVTNVMLNNDFKKGLFVAMSEPKIFQYYQWEQIEEFILKNTSK